MEITSFIEPEMQEEIQREIKKLKEAIADGTISHDDPIILEEREVFTEELIKNYQKQNDAIASFEIRMHIEKVFADELEVE